MQQFKATKDLVNGNRVKDFTKGEVYVRYQNFAYDGPVLSENTTLVNDHGEPHRVGNWLKYFKAVKV